MNESDDPSKLEALNDAFGVEPSADVERRAALRRLGPLAVLTPPVVMSLLVSKRASAASAPPDDPV